MTSIDFVDHGDMGKDLGDIAHQVESNMARIYRDLTCSLTTLLGSAFDRGQSQKVVEILAKYEVPMDLIKAIRNDQDNDELLGEIVDIMVLNDLYGI